jgi:transcriptional repressor NrdR
VLYCGSGAPDDPEHGWISFSGRGAGEQSIRMKCPYCGWTETRVIDSRDQGGAIQRRRRCEHCMQRFSTIERVVLSELIVVKRDGRREPFKREKLEEGLRRACQKRPIPVGELEAIVDEIEQSLYKMGQAEVATGVIGEMVMERLRRLDDIAYIRFASVYRSYPDIQAMRQELDRLLSGTNGSAGGQSDASSASDDQAARSTAPAAPSGS